MGLLELVMFHNANFFSNTDRLMLVLAILI